MDGGNEGRATGGQHITAAGALLLRTESLNPFLSLCRHRYKRYSVIILVILLRGNPDPHVKEHVILCPMICAHMWKF